MADGARLESVYTVKRIEGSNPSLSAKNKKAPFGAFLFFTVSEDLMRTLGSTNSSGTNLISRFMADPKGKTHGCVL